MVGCAARCHDHACGRYLGGGVVMAFVKIADIPVDGLMDDIADEEWKEFTGRQDHPASSHKDTEAIYLRWSKSMSIDSVFTDIHAVDYPALDRHKQFRRVLAKIMYYTKGKELGRAMIVKLKPGGYIDKHTDEGDYAEYYSRYHLVLQSNDLVSFQVDLTNESHWETVNMVNGELWWFNHRKPHCVDNASDEDRIHLIVDIRGGRQH